MKENFLIRPVICETADYKFGEIPFKTKLILGRYGSEMPSINKYKGHYVPCYIPYVFSVSPIFSQHGSNVFFQTLYYTVTELSNYHLYKSFRNC